MESTVQTSHDSEVRIRDTGVASEGRAEQGERSVNLKEFHRVSLTDGITLYVAPRRIEQWDNFVGRYPEKSIALDGFVYGKPRFEPEGAYLNSNHHEEVDRLSTRSTSAQIFIAIKQGLINTYTVDGAVRMNIFVNDPDQDTCLAVWLLKNHERILGQRSEPLINRLVELEDRFDVTAGAYPMNPNQKVLQELAWIFEPYTDARLHGRIPQMDGAEMAAVIDSVCNRISAFTLGDGHKVAPDISFNTLGGGPGWALIEEVGAQARTALFASGTCAFVAARFNDNDTMTYSIGRMSPFVQFPITELYDVLNEAEGIPADSSNRWGGSDIIGGSPRETGSRLKPTELEQIINRYLNPAGLQH